MTSKSNNPIMLIVTILLLLICLCGFICLFGGAATWIWNQRVSGPERIGFDYKGLIPEYYSGDTGAAGYIFIHQYPMPFDGNLTWVEYKNDAEPDAIEIREEVFLLVLRPVNGGYRVIYRQELLQDDITPRWDGVTRVLFDQPLEVMRGDLIAHWQPDGQEGGPIPMNIDDNSIEGRSIGKPGFQFHDTDPGKLLLPDGFSGQRDYFMQVQFVPGN
jgi:hypothetical protein